MAKATTNGAVESKTFAAQIAANATKIEAAGKERATFAARVERFTEKLGADDEATIAAVAVLAEIDATIDRLNKQTEMLQRHERVEQFVGPLIKRIGAIKVDPKLVGGNVAISALDAAVKDATDTAERAAARLRALTHIDRAVKASNLDAATLASMPAFAFEATEAGDSVTVRATLQRVSSGPRGSVGAYKITAAPDGHADMLGKTVRGDGAAYKSLADMLRALHPEEAKKLSSTDSKARTSARVIAEGLGYAFESVADDSDASDASDDDETDAGSADEQETAS